MAIEIREEQIGSSQCPVEEMGSEHDG